MNTKRESYVKRLRNTRKHNKDKAPIDHWRLRQLIKALPREIKILTVAVTIAIM